MHTTVSRLSCTGFSIKEGRSTPAGQIITLEASLSAPMIFTSYWHLMEAHGENLESQYRHF